MASYVKSFAHREKTIAMEKNLTVYGDDEDDEELRDGLETLEESLFAGSLTLKRPLEGSTLDSRVLKALRRQEEKRESAAARRREVRMRMSSLSPAKVT